MVDSQERVLRLSPALGLATDPLDLAALRRTASGSVDHVQITVAEARAPGGAASGRDERRRDLHRRDAQRVERGLAAGAPRPAPTVGSGPPAAARARAHASLLTSAVRGEVSRFLRADEVEAAWGWIEPIAHRWDSSPGRPPPYRTARMGPLDAVHLLGREGRAWHDIAC